LRQDKNQNLKGNYNVAATSRLTLHPKILSSAYFAPVHRYN